MIVKNEENNLGNCLKRIKPLVDEIIVVDTGSTDRTKDIAENCGSHTYDFQWTNSFADARNFSLAKASGYWILILDADEIISPSDFDTLKNITTQKDINPSSYSFVTRNYVNSVCIGWTANDRKYLREEAGTGWFPSEKVRLFPNDNRIRFENPVHEFVEPSLIKNGIAIRKCHVPIHHYGPLKTQKHGFKAEYYLTLGKMKHFQKKEVDIMAIYELAVQAAEMGKYEEAVTYWEKALEMKPDFFPAYYGMGNICFKLSRYENALMWFQITLQHKPDFREAIVMCATCEMFTGDIETAVSLLEDFLQEESTPIAIFPLAAAYFCLNRRENGHAYTKKLKDMNFHCAAYFSECAKALISVGRIAFAISLLEAAIESDNRTDETSVLLRECYNIRRINNIEPPEGNE